VNPADHSFGKEHRLCGKKRIDRLFAGGRSFFAYPFRCVWSVAGEEGAAGDGPYARILISVAKKNHKRAVARNKLKRRTREAYRLNRHRWEGLALPPGRILNIALIYTPKEILEYSVIEHGVVKILSEIRKRLAPGADLPAGAAD
jgi:ribonuclease P protein component